jgi:hypothetical protein
MAFGSFDYSVIVVGETMVLGRCSPQHRNRIIKALSLAAEARRRDLVGRKRIVLVQTGRSHPCEMPTHEAAGHHRGYQ